MRSGKKLKNTGSLQEWQRKLRLGPPAVLNTPINLSTFTNRDGQLVISPLPNPTIEEGINGSLDFLSQNIGTDLFS